MTAGDSIVSDVDRELIKRVSLVLALVFAFTAAFTHLERTYARKFFDITGNAKWIWAQSRMSDNVPQAFFAARDFDLPPNRVFTRLKVLGDPEYTVFVNGTEIGGRLLDARRGQETERVIDTYDISQLVQTGRNRIVVAVRAASDRDDRVPFQASGGGVNVDIDLAPQAIEGGLDLLQPGSMVEPEKTVH